MNAVKADCGKSARNAARAVAGWKVKRMRLNHIMHTAYSKNSNPFEMNTPV